MWNELFGGPVAANDNKRACIQCGGPVTGDLRKKFCCAKCRHQSRATTPGSDHKNTCPVCRVEFVGRASKKYCSDPCSRRAHYARTGDAQKDRALARAPIQECEQCGREFKGIPKEGKPLRFCSRACGARYTKADNTIKGLVTKAKKYGQGIKPISFKVYRPLCDCCGTRFTAPQISSRLCSEECRTMDARKQSMLRSVANDNVDRSPRPCGECGNQFSPEYGNKLRVFCSARCSKKNGTRKGKAARKAKLRTSFVESVDPIKVFIRDKWKCQICGVNTPRNLRGSTDARAPELDHIMPLALGGAHSYMNTQCACRRCNGLKSNTPPLQPSLFAYAA